MPLKSRSTAQLEIWLEDAGNLTLMLGHQASDPDSSFLITEDKRMAYNCILNFTIQNIEAELNVRRLLGEPQQSQEQQILGFVEFIEGYQRSKENEQRQQEEREQLLQQALQQELQQELEQQPQEQLDYIRELLEAHRRVAVGLTTSPAVPMRPRRPK